MALRNAFEEMATEATIAERYGGGKSAATATLTASGDNTVIAAPGVGSQIKLYWVSAITDPDQSTSPLIIVKASGGTEYYRVYAVAHWEPFLLPDNEALIVNLQTNSNVAFTAHYEVI